MEREVELSGWMRWFTASEGGRAEPHPGGRYTPTAAATSGTGEAPWSISFDDVPAGPGIGLGEGAVHARWPNGGTRPSACGPGTRLIITEGLRPVADVEILGTAIRAERPWTFRVTESFGITGRGVGVFGDLTGEIDRNGGPAELQSRERLLVVPQVWLEFARVAGGERRALLLRGVAKQQIGPGSVMRGRPL
ncbi:MULTISPECIES: hypothetical protein [unclassified Streptomyces]|uniref:hypothetical protein n=1 Tax=unclassified Streptomyces TaxID=2593676 RepID=UPI00114D11B0|nr:MULTISPECIES: hypothetical protein [unclassified Streptomyces]MYS24986.1 hypothetical protein [Streptomyces sp. SID4948]